MAVRSYVKEGKKYFMVEVKRRNENGKQLYRSRQGITSERRAIDVEFELKKKLELIVDKKVSTDWQSWFQQCIEILRPQFLPSTIIGYGAINSKWVKPVWNGKEIAEISKLDVHRLIFNELPDSLSANTRRNILKAVRKIFQMAVDEGILDRNPTTGVTVKVAEVEQKVLTKTEIGVLLMRAKEMEHPFYPIWFFALQTGMRSGEMIALKWSDIDFERKMIPVSKQWSSKNGFTVPKSRKNRIVPISEDLAKFLKILRLSSGEVEFVLPRLREWEHGEQSKVIKGFCEAIGITAIKFHDLRATFITHMLSAGVSLVKVMSIVGHSELKTTNGYLRKAGVDIVGATNALDIQAPEATEAKVVRIGAVRR